MSRPIEDRAKKECCEEHKWVAQQAQPFHREVRDPASSCFTKRYHQIDLGRATGWDVTGQERDK